MFLLTSFVSLTWWQMTLWIVYSVYFIIRAADIWQQTASYGIAKGYKYVFFGYNGKDIRLYHIIHMLFDIPPAIIGLFFPLLQKIFSFKVYTFKEEKKESVTIDTGVK